MMIGAIKNVEAFGNSRVGRGNGNRFDLPRSVTTWHMSRRSSAAGMVRGVLRARPMHPLTNAVIVLESGSMLPSTNLSVGRSVTVHERAGEPVQPFLRRIRRGLCATRRLADHVQWAVLACNAAAEACQLQRRLEAARVLREVLDAQGTLLLCAPSVARTALGLQMLAIAGHLMAERPEGACRAIVVRFDEPLRNTFPMQRSWTPPLERDGSGHPLLQFTSSFPSTAGTVDTLARR